MRRELLTRVLSSRAPFCSRPVAERMERRGILSGAWPTGPESPINTFTTANQSAPAVAVDVGGNFVVAWQSTDAPSHSGICAQRSSAAARAM